MEVEYEASQGRRVNVIGAYWCAGVEEGRFVHEARARIPKDRTPGSHGLSCEDVGVLDAQALLGFVWHEVGGKPVAAPEGWKRQRPAVVVLDNYSVHKSKLVQEQMAALQEADIHLVYPSSYSPELSEMEPIWKALKYHEMQRRSYGDLAVLLKAVREALATKGQALHRPAHAESASLSLCAA